MIKVVYLLMTIMFFLHKDIIIPMGKTFAADSRQIVLFHYQTVKWKEGLWLAVNHYLWTTTFMTAVGLHAADLNRLPAPLIHEKYSPKLDCADSCSIFSGPKLFYFVCVQERIWSQRQHCSV